MPLPLPSSEVGAAVIGTAGAMYGASQSARAQHRANVANRKMAREQMAFQERMSSTAWQRSVADMRAAGLNPALAYQKGGADGASGAAATFQNEQAAAPGVAEGAARIYAGIRNSRAQVASQMAQTDLTKAQAQQLKVESLARLQAMEAEARIKTSDARYLEKTLDERTMTPKLENRKRDEEVARMQEETKNIIDWRPLHLEKLKADIAAQISHASQMDSVTALHQLELPRARNLARAEKSWWKRRAAPFMNDAQAAKRIVIK